MALKGAQRFFGLWGLGFEDLGFGSGTARLGLGSYHFWEPDGFHVETPHRLEEIPGHLGCSVHGLQISKSKYQRERVPYKEGALRGSESSAFCFE